MAFTHAVSALSPFIVRDMGLSALQLGALTGTVYFTAAVGSASGARVIDRAGLKAALVGSFIISTVALITGSLALAYWVMVTAACAGGIAAAMSNPVTSAYVALHVSERPGLFLGLKQAGAQLFAFYCGIVLPVCALALGWRAAMLLGALPIGVGAVVALTRGPASTRRIKAETQRPMTSPTAGGLALYAFLMGAGQGPVQTFLPLYAFEELGYPEVRAGMLAGAMAVSAVVGRVLWGHFGTRLRPRVLLRTISSSAVVAVAAVVMSRALGPWLLWIGAVTFGSTATAWAVATLVVVDRKVHGGHVAVVAGKVMRAAYGGVLLSNVAFGWVVSSTEGYATAWAIVLVIFLLSLATGGSRLMLATVKQ